MPRIKITALIALCVTSAFLLVLSFGPPATGRWQPVSAGLDPEDNIDPDLPSKHLLRDRIDKEKYMRLRDAYISSLRGIDLNKPFDPILRSRAIEQLQDQQSALLSAAANGTVQPFSLTNWTEIGPFNLPNGQTQQFPATTSVNGRSTAVVVDPTDSNKVTLQRFKALTAVSTLSRRSTGSCL